VTDIVSILPPVPVLGLVLACDFEGSSGRSFAGVDGPAASASSTTIFASASAAAPEAGPGVDVTCSTGSSSEISSVASPSSKRGDRSAVDVATGIEGVGSVGSLILFNNNETRHQ
jgi:hypothetical protein